MLLRRIVLPFSVLALFVFPALTVQAQEEGSIFREVPLGPQERSNRLGDEKVIGQAWGDYDADGWLDLYVTDHAGPNTLYRNLGDGSFEISPLNEQVSLPEAYSGGAIFVDFDNDGWQDLYVLNWGENRLYRNVDGQAFQDVTERAGVLGSGNSKTASWGDFNQDGWLDLYVANWACYPRCGRPSSGDSDKLYQSNGDGTFRDVTNLLSSKITGAGFVASFTDFDNDGDLDIYLINDEFINPVGNGLWRNDGAGCDGWCFSEISQEARADTKLMGMGLATADYDNDGDQDFYFSNAGPMALLQNRGNGTFSEVASEAGVDSPDTIGWGAVFFDFDNDGWQDLYLALSDATSDGQGPINPLYQNRQDGTFRDLTLSSGAADAGVTLGVATADYDRDGRVDLLVGNVDTGYKLYRNESAVALEQSWISLELSGSGRVNRDAIGTRVILTLPDGETRMQEVISGASLGAGNSLALHFGLGEASMIKTLEILWPDGTTQQFEDVAPNRYLALGYPQARADIDAQEVAIYGAQPLRSAPSTGPFLQLMVLLALAGICASLFWQLSRRG